MDDKTLVNKLLRMQEDINAIVAEMRIAPDKMRNRNRNVRRDILELVVRSRKGIFKTDLVTASDICEELNKCHISHKKELESAGLPLTEHEYRPVQIGTLLGKIPGLKQYRGTRGATNIRVWAIHVNKISEFDKLGTAEIYNVYESQQRQYYKEIDNPNFI